MTARLVAYAHDHLGANDGVTGHCLYRNGEYAEAVNVLTKAIQGPLQMSLIWDKYFLAMAYEQLGKYDLAERWLTEANQAVADEKALAALVPTWALRLDLEMLRDEAEQLIFGKGRYRPVIADLMNKRDWEAALARLDALAKDNELDFRDWTNRGRCYAGLEQWDKALSAYDKAIALGANDYAVRGECYVRKGQWSQAQADFREALRLEPERSEVHSDLVIAELAANHLDGYRAECKKMYDRFGHTTNPSHAANIGYVAVFLPDSGIEKDDLVRLARQAVALFAGNERLLGAALVRAGQYQAAIEQFDKARENYPRKGWDWLFLAMAHHHLRHNSDAKECLAKAVKWIEDADQKALYADTGSTWVAWYERIEVQHLRAEAESLIMVK